MRSLHISDNEISAHTDNSVVLRRGNMYFLEGRVTQFEFDADELIIYAAVDGSEPYDVEIGLTENGAIRGSWCSCPAYYRYDGACKHIVAVLKTAQRKLNRAKVVPLENNSQTAHEVIAFFANVDREPKKEEVNLELCLELTGMSYSLHAAIDLKIGLERLYVVKNIREFLIALDGYQPIEFGKKFTFEPARHTFAPRDQAILNLLQGILAQEAPREQYYYSNTPGSFHSKTVKLNDYFLKKLLNLLEDKPFLLQVNTGAARPGMSIKQGLPLDFSIDAKGQDLVLTLDAGELPRPITREGDYFYYQENIYRAAAEQKKYFVPLLGKFLNKKQQIIFPAGQKEQFVSEALPYFKKLGRVDIAPALEKTFCREALTAKLFFDRIMTDPAADFDTESDGIAARLEFYYGEKTINPFSAAAPEANNTSAAEEKIIIRDTDKEHKIFELLEQAGFIVRQGEIHLYDNDKIFNFAANILPELQELTEVYYSDHFKSLSLRSAASFSGRVRLAEDLNLLEFSLQSEDIDNTELDRIFSSVKLKKRYHRLKDGSFIDLSRPELENIALLLEHLDLKAGDLNQHTVQLPKYRALYIDNYLRQHNLQGFGRNRAFKQLVQNILEPQDMEYQVPAELENVLREYQKTGFKWLKTMTGYGFGGILADDMGLGKTLQVISFVLSEKGTTSAPSLVIAPTSLVYNWYEEIKKFVPEMKVAIISGTPRKRQESIKEISPADIAVTSYPLIRRDIDLYKEIEFAYCFLDEAQHIKNPNTINAKTVQQIKAGGYFALTGTPIENSLTELWSIFNFVMPGFLNNHHAFQKKYELPAAKGEDPTALTELSRHVRPFILRRMKKDVLKELPDKIETKLTAEMTGEQEKLYLAFLKQAKGEISKEISAAGFDRSRIKILAALTRLRQICCHPSLFMENYTGASGKLLLLQEVLADALASGHRILLFSQFTSMLDIIRAHLEQQQTGYLYLQGSTKAEQRQEMVRAFNAGAGSVFLISLKAGGTGLNLTGADMVVHYDPWWNPAVEEQATDRAHRIGQKNVVQVLKLITRGTIEEKIYNLQHKKKELVNAVIQPGETFLTKLSEEELKNLFEVD